MSITTTTAVEPSSDPLDASRWTTPQELCLLQSLTHYKPVGIHKHFRMVAILNALLASGTIPQPVTDHPHVSTTEGVWRKLGSLYDLKSLDEREDAIFADVDDVEYWREFELNDNEFGGKMWERRLADEEEEDWSAEEEAAADVTMRESTIADGDDPRMSPAGSVKGTRASGRRAADRRLAEVKQQETAAGSGRASRRTSKAASPSVKAEEDTEMHDAADGEEASGEEEDESGQDETEDDSRKGGRHTRRGTRRGGRTKARPQDKMKSIIDAR